MQRQNTCAPPERTRAKLAGAQQALARGHRIIPVYEMTADDECACGNRCDPKSRGKHPRGGAWQRRASNNPDQFRAWARAFPDTNWGVATGAASNLYVYDLDFGPDGEPLGHNTWIERYGPIPDTLTVRTGSGAVQIYTQYPTWPRPDGKPWGNTAKLALGPGIDSRGDGGQVVLPGSVSYKGAYSVLNDAPIIRADGDPALVAAFTAIVEAVPKPRPAGEPHQRKTSLASGSPGEYTRGLDGLHPWIAAGVDDMLADLAARTTPGNGRSNLLSGRAKRMSEMASVSRGVLTEAWVYDQLMAVSHANGFIDEHSEQYAHNQIERNIRIGRGGCPAGWPPPPSIWAQLHTAIVSDDRDVLDELLSALGENEFNSLCVRVMRAAQEGTL